MPYAVVLVGCMLVCTLGMGAIMWLMMRGMGGGSQQMPRSSVVDVSPLAGADRRQISEGHKIQEAQVAELRAQIETLEMRNRVLQGELETQRADTTASRV